MLKEFSDVNNQVIHIAKRINSKKISRMRSLC